MLKGTHVLHAGQSQDLQRTSGSRWLGLLAWILIVPSQLYGQPPRPTETLPEPAPSFQPWNAERLPPTEHAPPINIADIEQLALANNPTLARAAAIVEATRGDWLQSGLYPNPKVGVGQQQTGSGGRAEQDNVAFSQEVVLGHKLKLNRAVAEQAILQAQHQLAAQQLRVLTDARIAFYHVLVAQQQQRLTAELVAIAQRGVESARGRNPARDVGENDVLEASIELHKAQIDETSARNRHTAAWRTMSAVIGIQNFPMQPVNGQPEQLPPSRSWESVLHGTLQLSPEIASASANLQRASAVLNRASVEKIPNVTFDGLFNWRDNGIGGRPDGGFLLSVPLPVWNRNQGGVSRARGDVIAAERAIEQLHFDLQNRLAPIFERYENARFQVSHYQTLILPAAARALELTRRNYESGMVEYDDLLTSQRTNAQANLDFLTSLRELLIAEAEIAGMTLTASLATSP